ncbi:hypothetical protein BC830DRAFT_1123383 [Chytriomyces sp. MP71]|nr:hypothetical protein BC830DRAFT_1123383 [Chytriomyces sp. MP71]
MKYSALEPERPSRISTVWYLFMLVSATVLISLGFGLGFGAGSLAHQGRPAHLLQPVNMTNELKGAKHIPEAQHVLRVVTESPTLDAKAHHSISLEAVSTATSENAPAVTMEFVPVASWSTDAVATDSNNKVSVDSGKLRNENICSRIQKSYPGVPPIQNNFSGRPHDYLQYAGSVPRTSSESSGSRLRLITISDKGRSPPEMMCSATLYSAALNSIPLEVYGATEQSYFKAMHETMTDHKAVKMDILLSLLCNFDEGDSVLMVDAFDVIFQRPFAELEYLYYKRWNRPEFVISTEANCWPPWVDGLCGPDDRPPVPPNGVAYINSGVLVGTVPTMTDVVQAALEMREKGITDDQGAMARVVYENYLKRAYMMDHLSELSTSGQPPKLDFIAYHSEGREYYLDQLTRTVPMLIHLNGGGKEKYDPKKLWYFGADGKLKEEVKDEVASYKIWLDGEEVTVGEMCKEYM